jgi:hypothetical protein
MIQNEIHQTGHGEELGPRTREEALAGLRDGRWQQRLRCLSWLHRADDYAVLEAVAPLTRDPKRQVRQLATWLIGRRRDGAGFPDAVALLIERVQQDESPKVRRMALQVLAFDHAHPDLCGFFQALLDREVDPKLHRLAGIGLWLSREASR